MKTTLKFTLIAIVAFSIYAFKSVQFDGVKGWFLTGSNPQNYEMGTEKNPERNSTVAFLKSKEDKKGFGTIMQSFSANNYLGKRIKLTGYIKSSDVNDWAGMWLRIDGDKNKMLGFDNMQKRPIKGNREWKQYSIVLDVPNGSQFINYGVLLAGGGSVWIDDFKFEVVGNEVETTGMILKK
jgi:hypothetical protein